MENNLTPFQRWQMEKFGNIIKESKMQDADIRNNVEKYFDKCNDLQPENLISKNT